MGIIPLKTYGFCKSVCKTEPVSSFYSGRLCNASWHKSKSLNWGRFEPIFLPPYSPDLNPIERLWLIMKAQWF
ncbi:MAG: transposase, partial [Desulfomonilaceae bacterium]